MKLQQNEIEKKMRMEMCLFMKPGLIHFNITNLRIESELFFNGQGFNHFFNILYYACPRAVWLLLSSCIAQPMRERTKFFVVEIMIRVCGFHQNKNKTRSFIRNTSIRLN